jgi:hypothetical protein
MKNNQESTYALIVRSEEKSRSALETVLYSTFILSVVFAIWQFAQQPITIPVSGLEPRMTTSTEVIVTNSPS